MVNDAERQSRILRKAADRFLRDGFERTTLDKIAASARVSKQIIYELFESKEKLFERVIRYEMDRGAPVSPLNISDVPTTLFDFAEDMYERFARPNNFGLFRENIVATRKFPVIASMLHERRRAASGALANYLQSLMDTGHLRHSVGTSIDLATRLGGMVVEGSRYFLGHELPSREERAKNIKFAVDIFLHGARNFSMEEPPEPTVAQAKIELSSKVHRRLKQDRFELLCDTALAEFLEHGFERTSLDRIVHAAEVGRATIYRQMGNKEGLLRYVIGRELENMRSELALPEAEDAYTNLVLLSRSVLDLHLTPRSIALHHFLIKEALLFPDLARQFYDLQIERIRRPFEESLKFAGVPKPSGRLIRTYHVLATFGVRYIGNLRLVEEEERDRVSLETAAIILKGLKVER